MRIHFVVDTFCGGCILLGYVLWWIRFVVDAFCKETFCGGCILFGYVS